MENKNLMLAQLLFPNITKTPADMEAEFPPRDLPEGAKVTRLAPSPTGFVHFGNLFPALVSERLARQSGGVKFKFASLCDMDLLQKAFAEAGELLLVDPKLQSEENSAVARYVSNLFDRMHSS